MSTNEPTAPASPAMALFTRESWWALAYLISYLPIAVAFMAVALVSVIVSSVLSIFWLGFPLLLGAALLIRGMAEVERRRAFLVARRVESAYRPVTDPGIISQIRTRWTDPATFRNLAYLLPLAPLLFVFDLVVAVLWVIPVAGITLPLWYWSIPITFDDGTVGHGIMIGYVTGPEHNLFDGGFGIWVGDLPTALLVMAVCFIVATITAPLMVRAARSHAAIARSLLGPAVDPLEPARRVLRSPGPLSG
ncbi:sensor domain-containing protein [Actinoalloteichus caeruleus]|uniref:sensor domain-containing protein n=1 Tax=Actinoalloteichus cyanogriseus TaxID=2893586 RepID=UPI003AAC6313